MAMEDHTTPSAAKTATNLVLRASKLGWKHGKGEENGETVNVIANVPTPQ